MAPMIIRSEYGTPRTGIVFECSVCTLMVSGSLVSAGTTSSLYLAHRMVQYDSGSSEAVYHFSNFAMMNALAVSTDDKLISFSFANGGSIFVLSTDTWKIVAQLGSRHDIGEDVRTPGPGSVVQLSFSDDSTRLVAWFDNGRIVLWDITVSGDRSVPLKEFSTRGSPTPQHLSFSGDHTSIFSSGSYYLIPKPLQPLCADISANALENKTYHYLEGGWVWSGLPAGEKRRICWVPKEYRDFIDARHKGLNANTCTVAAQGTIMAFGCQNGQVILINLSALNSQ